MKRRYIVNLFARCLYWLPAVTLFFYGCQERTEGPTKGAITVYADESLFGVVSATADTFASLYPDTKITVEKTSARKGITMVLNGESKIFVSGRGLNAEETEFKTKNGVELKTIKYCFDGVAVVASPDIAIRSLSFDSLRLLIANKLPFKVVVPGINSGVYEYLRDSVMEGKELTGPLMQGSEDNVLRSVIGGNNTIAFLSWHNVPDDLRARALMIGRKNLSGIHREYFQPHPGYFVQYLYPLTRMCVIYLNEIRLGPASGFATFLAGNIGQKIVLERQLAPAAVPVKLVY